MIQKIIDFLDKSFGRIRTIGTLVLILFFIASICINGCSRKEAERMVEKITGLSVQNDILFKNNKELDEKLAQEKVWRGIYERKALALESEKKELSEENSKLKTKLKNIPSDLLKIPADSSYKYLTRVAYPYKGELKYPFNEPQVKGIHQSYEENITYENLIGTLESQLVNCEKIVGLKDTLLLSYTKSLDIQETQKANSGQIVNNFQEKEELYIKENKKLKRRILLFKVTTGLTTIAALVIAL